MSIIMVKVRATISIGNMTAATPPLAGTGGNHILSFNVDRSRGRPSTFNASLKVKHGDVSGTVQGDNIEIRAGANTSSPPLIYTGIVKSANIGPCREDPGYVILNVSGEDILSTLQNKKFTRRCRGSKGVWVSIDGIVRPGMRSGVFNYVPGEPMLTTVGASASEVETPVQTKQIPNPSNRAEKPPKNDSVVQEASMVVSHVSGGGNGPGDGNG